MAFREAKLYTLFDFQRFAENPRLAKIVEQTKARADTHGAAYMLDDEDINIWAAGDLDTVKNNAPEVFDDDDKS